MIIKNKSSRGDIEIPEEHFKTMMKGATKQTGITELTKERLGQYGLLNFPGVGKMNIKNHLLITNIRVRSGEPGGLEIYDLMDGNLGGFIFINCVLPNLRLSRADGNWVFINCEVGNLYIQDSYIMTLWIKENSSIQNVEMAFKTTCGSFELSKGSDCKEFYCHSESNVYGLLITDAAKIANMKISLNAVANSMKIKDKSECGGIELEMGSYCDQIEITGNSICNSLMVRTILCDLIKIDNSSCNSIQAFSSYISLDLINAQVPLIQIRDCELPFIRWKSGTKGELNVKKSKINHLDFRMSVIQSGSLVSILDSQIAIIHLEDVVVLGQLIFRGIIGLNHFFPLFESDSEIWSWGIQTEAKMSLHAIIKDQGLTPLQVQKNSFKELPLIIIGRSSLGKTEITDCKWRTFKFYYRDSRLLDIFINDSTLPNEIKVYTTTTIEGHDEYSDDVNLVVLYEQSLSAYGQLRRVFDNLGNTVVASQYFALSMEMQQKLLESGHNIYNVGNKSNTDRILDTVNFRLNKCSNDNGESWGKAFVFTLLTGLACYTIYYWSLNQGKDFDITRADHFFGNFFPFLDPTHRNDFMVNDKTELTNLSKGFDFLGRIVIGFGIYQFIAAFRRHGRKG